MRTSWHCNHWCHSINLLAPIFAPLYQNLAWPLCLAGKIALKGSTHQPFLLSPTRSSLLIALFGFSSHPWNLPDGNKIHSRWQLSSHFHVTPGNCCRKVIDTVINSFISIFPIHFCPQQTLNMKLFSELFPACSWRCSQNDLKTDNTAVISQGSPAMLW